MKTRIRPNHKLTYITFFILFVALEFLLWGICGTKPWLTQTPNHFIYDIVYTACALAVILVGMFIYIYKIYYVITDEEIVRHGNKLNYYRFNDIVYVDEEYSKKHVDMRFYMNTEMWVYLTMDKKKIIYNTIKEKCHLLDDKTFILKYPKAYTQEEIKKKNIN